MKSNQTFAIAANQAGDFGRQRLATVQIVEGKDFESKQLVRCIVLGQQNGGAGTVAKLLNDGEVVFVDEVRGPRRGGRLGGGIGSGSGIGSGIG